MVTSSLQSFHVPAATSDSHLSAPHHSSSASGEEDVVQSTSALLQDLDRSSALSFPNFAQSSVPHTVHSQAALTPRYDARKGKSSFSQTFIGPVSDNSSPGLMSVAAAAADSIAMTNKYCMTSLSHQISSSPGGNLEGHRILSDPLSCFTNCGSSSGVSSIAKIETAFPKALQDTSGSQHFHSFEQCTDHANAQLKSLTAYQSVSSAQQMPGIAILMPENQSLPGVSANHTSGGRGQPSVKAELQEDRKSDVPPAPPPPPKKPLSPYMRFSKGIWQQVKAANPGLSVCEVGAAIGRIWRELSDTDKQHYIDEFATDKARYDGEFQNYLRVTGLQASDLIKPRGKKKETKEKHSTSRSARQLEGQDVTSFVPPDQERSAEPQRQSNEVLTGGSGQQNAAFFVNHPDGVNNEGISVSSLPPFSQVWSNSEFLTGQDLLTQMVLSGQHRQQVEPNAARISQDGNALQLTKSCSNHTLISGHEQQAVVQRLSAPVNCTATGTAPGHSDIGSKGWPWPQVSVSLQSSQGIEQSNEGVLVYQLPASSSWPTNSVNNATANQSDQNGSLVLRNETELSMMSAIHQAQHGGTTPDGVDCVFRMEPGAVCATDDAGKHGIIVDQEKLQLRNALLEKSEEVLRLMKELEQMYRLIHQLKEQNDFFHQQWNLHHNNHSTAKSSGEVDGGGMSTRGT